MNAQTYSEYRLKMADTEIDEEYWFTEAEWTADFLKHAPGTSVDAQATPELVQCDCGHKCLPTLRMSGSHGSSCPACYDEMS